MYCLQYTKSDELLTPPVIKLAAEDVKKFLPDGVKNFLPTHVKNSLPRHVKNSLPCGCKITLPRTGGLCVMRKRAEGGFMRVVQLPIIVPHVVAALFMVNIFSRNGILARVCYMLGMINDQQQFPMLIYDANGVGIIMAYLWKEIPFIIYFVIALMANINGNFGEAAINLGAGKWTAFCRITLPLCKNTIISGFLIIFVFALGAYELPLILGATTPKALPILAYQQYIHPDLRNRPYAMALNGIIMIISLISALIYFIMTQKNMKELTDKK